MREQGRRDAAIETEQQPEAQVEEESPRVRFVGGAIPPVQVAEAEDPRVDELKRKVAALAETKFGGDYKKAFDHYDGDRDGRMTKDEIKSLLSDAGVGNMITRGAWADGILDKLDMNHDRGVSWAEFESVFKATA
jgi:EF hand domain-containing protein